MNTAGTRFEQKRNATHALIIRSAERLVETNGADALSLDSIADSADIARATLFNHFHSREDLLIEVLSPAFDDCIAMLESLHAEEGGISVESVVKACRFMWTRHRGAICRPGCERSITQIPLLGERHRALVALFTDLFHNLAKTTRFRLSRPEDTALLVFKTFIPILDAAASEDDPSRVFRDCLAGLILED